MSYLYNICINVYKKYSNIKPVKMEKTGIHNILYVKSKDQTSEA